MELRSGYKHTEVGVIPEGWEVHRLGDISDVKTGPFGSTLHESDYVQDGTPIITVEHLHEMGVAHTNIPMVSDADCLRLSAYSLEEDDIVFSRVGSIDRNSRIKSVEVGWLFSGRLLRVRPNKKKVYSPYLSYHFHDEPFKRRVRTVAVGQTMPSLNTQILNGIATALPPLPEQRAIAAALSDVDALIASLDRMIAKKRDMKQATMQELLTGKRRLTGFSGEWSIKSLGELGESLIGLTYSPDDVKSDGLLVLRSSNVFEGALRFEDNVYVDKIVPEKIIVKQGDILICARNGSRDLIGKCALINKHAEGMTFGAFMAVFRTPFTKFIYQQFQSDIVKRQIHEHLGATINQITNKSMNSFRIPFPDDDVERDAISTVLSDMDADIATMEQKLDKTRQLKQGMMQELLTGRVRLI